MGQKSKNAGKKQSKICNKKATSKSICGGNFQGRLVTPIQKMEMYLMSLERNSTYVKGVGNVLKSSRTALRIDLVDQYTVQYI